MQPHAGQPVETTGRPLGEGSAAMILVHGRGAGPRNILELADVLAHPDFTYLAPAAAGNTWYPYSFMADTASNEPGISSGLAVLGGLIERVIQAGVPRDRIVLSGFSQGACLMSEYAVRHAGRYGGVIAFSGGLIGPPGTTWPYEGDFAGSAQGARERKRGRLLEDGGDGREAPVPGNGPPDQRRRDRGRPFDRGRRGVVSPNTGRGAASRKCGRGTTGQSS